MKLNFRKALKIFIALVWLLNGLLCKVLNLVPRHSEIVHQILQVDFYRELTILIGIGEIGIALWILLDRKVKTHTFLQVALVLTMNILEFFLVPELLLWGKWNSLFAFCFMVVVLFHYKLYLEFND